jgi:hypothetical protein
VVRPLKFQRQILLYSINCNQQNCDGLKECFPKVSCTTPGGARIKYRGQLEVRGGRGPAEERGRLELGPSDRVLRLFTNEVTLCQTVGNGYHINKPIRRIKNVPTLKWLLNVVSHFIVIIFLVGCANRCSEECFYRVEQGAQGISCNQGGGGPKKFGNLCSEDFDNCLFFIIKICSTLS